MAGAVLEGPGGLLLVQNRRRNGSLDWSTPGGVIDAHDESVLHGLAREVDEEVGLEVSRWDGLLYEVRAEAIDLGWSMRCEVHRAERFTGELRLADPDRIVVGACFASHAECRTLLADCFPWVREPLSDWLRLRWGIHEPRTYHYALRGTGLDDFRVERTWVA